MTSIDALRFAIQELEIKQRRISVGGKRFTPLPGSEDQFERLEQCIIQLKAICQAMQSEGVRKSLAEWDDKILTHQEPEMRL